MAVLIQEEDFNLSDELKLLKAGTGDAGAIISFIGTVRDNSFYIRHDWSVKRMPVISSIRC